MPLISNSPASPKLIKRKAELDDRDTSPNKRSKHQPILEWLSDTESLRRSTSAPPSFDLEMPSQPQPPVFARPQTPAVSAISSASTKIKTDDSNYRTILNGNGLYVDRHEELQPKEITDFLARHILKSGTARSTEELLRISQSIKASLHGSENVVMKTIQSSLFSALPVGIHTGGNVPWSEQPLPNITTFWGALSTPKPDIHFGYPIADQESNFTSEQNSVITHPFAIEYTQPTSDNSFPFLHVEVKSESKGGTLYHAENQAAGGGAHRVNSMRWLHRTAGMKEDVLQSLSFSMCVTGRLINLYVHYYSQEIKQFIMSCIRSYLPARPPDIQDCLWHIANIMEFALDTRRKEIVASLDLLYPISEEWPRKRRTGSRSSSRSASISATSASGVR